MRKIPGAFGTANPAKGRGIHAVRFLGEPRNGGFPASGANPVYRDGGHASHSPLFLWAYNEAPGLVRSAATGDTARAAYVGEVLGNYEELSALLKVHLRREVTEVMPVVDRVLSEKEMNAVGQHGIDQFDKKFLVSYLGMVLATNPPQDRKELFKEIPVPVRLAYRVVGRRMYRRQYSALFPGREIPATL